MAAGVSGTAAGATTTLSGIDAQTPQSLQNPSPVEMNAAFKFGVISTFENPSFDKFLVATTQTAGSLKLQQPGAENDVKFKVPVVTNIAKDGTSRYRECVVV